MYKNMDSFLNITNKLCYSNDDEPYQSLESSIDINSENNSMDSFGKKEVIQSKIISLIQKFRYCHLPLNNYVKYVRLLKSSGLSRKLIKKTVLLYKKRIKKSDLPKNLKEKNLKLMKSEHPFLNRKVKKCNSQFDLLGSNKSTDKDKYLKISRIFSFKKLPLMNYVKLRKKLELLVPDRKKIKKLVCCYKKRINNSNLCLLNKKKALHAINLGEAICSKLEIKKPNKKIKGSFNDNLNLINSAHSDLSENMAIEDEQPITNIDQQISIIESSDTIELLDPEDEKVELAISELKTGILPCKDYIKNRIILHKSKLSKMKQSRIVSLYIKKIKNSSLPQDKKDIALNEVEKTRSFLKCTNKKNKKELICTDDYINEIKSR